MQGNKLLSTNPGCLLAWKWDLKGLLITSLVLISKPQGLRSLMATSVNSHRCCTLHPCETSLLQEESSALGLVKIILINAGEADGFTLNLVTHSVPGAHCWQSEQWENDPSHPDTTVHDVDGYCGDRPFRSPLWSMELQPDVISSASAMAFTLSQPSPPLQHHFPLWTSDPGFWHLHSPDEKHQKLWEQKIKCLD